MTLNPDPSPVGQDSKRPDAVLRATPASRPDAIGVPVRPLRWPPARSLRGEVIGRLAVLACVAAAALLAACSEDEENPVGAGELPQLSDSIQEVFLVPVSIETFETPTEDRVFGDTLVVAHDLPDPSGFESRLLVRFALTISDTTSGPITVDSARVRLVVTDVTPDSLPFVMNRVTEAWSEAEVTWTERMFGIPWSQPGATFDPTPVLEGVVVADSTFLSLPDSLVQRWLDEPETNNGLLLRLQTAGRARLLAASTTGLISENGPRLRLFFSAADSSRVTNVFATNDAYVTEFRGAVLPGIGVGNEPFLRSVLKFDLSGIPKTASINLAELRLVPRQVVAPLNSMRLELRRVVSPSLGANTVFSGGALDTVTIRPDSTITLSRQALASVVRVWQADSTLNLGLGLQVTRPRANLGFAVFGDASAAPDDRPRLRLIFTPALESDLDRTRR